MGQREVLTVHSFSVLSCSGGIGKERHSEYKQDQRGCLRMHVSLHISQAALNLLFATQRS